MVLYLCFVEGLSRVISSSRECSSIVAATFDVRVFF
jgi:hypothetical protein